MADTVQLVTGLIAMDELRLARTRIEAARRRDGQDEDERAMLEATWLRAEVAVHEGGLDDAERDVAVVLRAAPRPWTALEWRTLRTRMIIQQARGDLRAAASTMALLSPLVGHEPLLRGYAGWLLLDQGRNAEAAHELLTALVADARDHGIDDPGLAPWRSGAAIALARLGDRDQAVEHAGAEVDRARELAAARPLGRALSALGIALGGEDGLPAHAEAVKVLEGSPARRWLPGALLEQGSALRRLGRRVEARRPLARAGRLAEGMGLMRVAASARQELHGAGGRTGRPVGDGAARMTAGERRVAVLAARGHTTPQIAERLAISRRTVDDALQRAYRKLDIHARGELPDALGMPVLGPDKR